MSHCPACNASALRESVKQKQFVTDGRSIEFAFVFSKCGECGAEVVSEAQSVENKRRKRCNRENRPVTSRNYSKGWGCLLIENICNKEPIYLRL